MGIGLVKGVLNLSLGEKIDGASDANLPYSLAAASTKSFLSTVSKRSFQPPPFEEINVTSCPELIASALQRESDWGF